METGAWRRELGEPGIGRGGTRGCVTGAFVGSRTVLLAVERGWIGREGIGVGPRGPIMIVGQVGTNGQSVLFGEAVQVGVSVRDGRDSSALFGGDVDECVEAEEGWTWGWMVGWRGERMMGGCVGVCGAGCAVRGGVEVVEDGEEGGGWVFGWLWVVKEGIDGAGSVGVTMDGFVGAKAGRGRVTEKGRDVHSTWGHGSERVKRFTQLNYREHVQRDIAIESTRKTIQTAIQRRHRTQVPSESLSSRSTVSMSWTCPVLQEEDWSSSRCFSAGCQEG